jgi:hypothetical protein
MAKRPWYTSQELIDAVKRKISVPLTQVTFTDDDFLNFANEEMFLSQIPSIMQFHEEYLVNTEVIPLVENVSNYAIPSRAIGMKLRDLFYQDSNNNLYPLANVGLGNADSYSYGSTGVGQTPRFFYLEGDDIVIVPKMNGSITGSIVAKYYLRPNSLVLNERAAICNAFVKMITVTNASMVSGDRLVIDDLVLVAGTDFAIGASSTATAANIATAISSSDDYSATSDGAVVSVVFEDISVEFSTTSAGLAISTQTGIQCDSIPEHFVEGMLVDFLQTEGGHRTYSFDVEVPTGGVTSDAVYFDDDDIPSKFVVGDYICEQNECIIPQIPSDLHNLLAERTCARVQESLGDIQGVSTTTARISQLEASQSVLIDSRVDGAPRKVVNRHSLLRIGKYGRRRF